MHNLLIEKQQEGRLAHHARIDSLIQLHRVYQKGFFLHLIDFHRLLVSHEVVHHRSQEFFHLQDVYKRQANNPNYLDNHLRKVIADIYEKNQVELLAIGIGHDVTKYYNHAITISNADSLGETLLDELTELFE